MPSDTVYLTPTEWQGMATGLDFSRISDADQLSLISRATVLVDAYVGRSLLLTAYVNEQHPWRASRRVYLRWWPKVADDSDAVRIRMGATVTATMQGSEIYVNNTQRYIEISSLALAFGVVPEVLSLGLYEPVVEVDYSAGYATIPDAVKFATAISAMSLGLNEGLVQEGSAGMVSFTIGSYQVAFGTKQLGGVAGISNTLPEEAKSALKDFVSISLR